MSATQHLDQTFGALADSTRRAIVARLCSDEALSVSTLAEPFDMSLPAVMKHLGVLERAGMIRCTKIGRSVHCRLQSDAMKDAIDWLARHEAFWNRQLDSLAAFVEGSSEDRDNEEKS